jgi:2-deoxy-D-gluconate 3-dehydrogenase
VLALSLDGKVAVVTGASRGLGEAVARAFGDAGADVALLARSADDLEVIAHELSALGRRVLALPVDIGDEAAVEAAAEKVVATFGRVDILVNNAGVALPAPLLELTLADLRKMLDVNVVGMFLASRAFGAHMVAQRRGTVINIASIAGMVGEPELTAYSATKGAVLAFTRALAAEWARQGVTVNAVAPGYFRTDLSKRALDDAQLASKIIGRIPLRRFGQPEELGPLLVYLASDAAAYMTGSIVVLDGGQTAR